MSPKYIFLSNLKLSKFGASVESEKEIKIVQKEGRRITCKWITKERGTLL